MGGQARTVREKRNKRRKILKAAGDVFFEKGFSGTRVSQITARAGISTGTFYLYFRNKIEVYKTIQDEGLDILLDMIRRAIAGAGPGAMERITALTETYLRFYEQYPGYFGLIAILGATPRELKETESVVSEEIYRKTRYLLETFADILETGVARGELLPMDTAKVAVIFWGMMDGLVLLEERRNLRNVVGMRLPEMLQQALRVSLYGLLAGPGDKSAGAG